MDTNSIVELAKAFSTQRPDNYLPIWVLVITALMPTLAAIAAYIQARSAHLAVNGKSTAMEKMIADLTAKVLELSQDKATIVEAQRGQAVRDADVAGQTRLVGFTDEQVEQMKRALAK